MFFYKYETAEVFLRKIEKDKQRALFCGKNGGSVNKVYSEPETQRATP